MINEFADDIGGTIDHLDYLADMGINCIELTPLSNIEKRVDWGFEPIGYFGVDERLGKRKDMQKLINEAHQRHRSHSGFFLCIYKSSFSLFLCLQRTRLVNR